MDKTIYTELWDTILKNKPWSGEIKNKTKNGDTFWVYLKIYPNYDENGEKIGYNSIHHNITNLKIVEKLATIDSLTKVYNRHFFNQIFDNYIIGAKRDNSLVCFMMLDIDYFKQFNDNYGHQQGDYALQKVAEVIKNKLHRTDDYLFRLGGEEFGILFKSSSLENSINFGQKIIKQVEDLKIEHKENNRSEYLTISAGLVCEKAKEIKSTKELYNETDKLLYNAKANGRNQLVVNKKV